MGIARWNQRFLEQPEAGPPLPLVVTTAEQLPPGRALDLACGTGRNALWLAQQGWSVTAVDGAPAAIAALSGVTAILADLETGEYRIAESAWDLIVITYYLQRDLFEPAKAGLLPGGTLIAIALLTEAGEDLKLTGCIQASSSATSTDGRSCTKPKHRTVHALQKW
jgi:SAM-dependent methyltransferase